MPLFEQLLKHELMSPSLDWSIFKICCMFDDERLFKLSNDGVSVKFVDWVEWFALGGKNFF